MAFECSKPFWHTYTSGKQTPFLFENDQAMSLVMNIIAHAAFVYADKIRIVSFEVMNNHLHFIIAGDLDSIDNMMSFILKRIRRSFGLETLPEVSSKPIDDLASMRNHIVYVHRNGYVAHPFQLSMGIRCLLFHANHAGKAVLKGNFSGKPFDVPQPGCQTPARLAGRDDRDVTHPGRIVFHSPIHFATFFLRHQFWNGNVPRCTSLLCFDQQKR